MDFSEMACGNRKRMELDKDGVKLWTLVLALWSSRVLLPESELFVCETQGWGGEVNHISPLSA